MSSTEKVAWARAAARELRISTHDAAQAARSGGLEAAKVTFGLWVLGYVIPGAGHRPVADLARLLVGCDDPMPEAVCAELRSPNGTSYRQAVLTLLHRSVAWRS